MWIKLTKKLLSTDSNIHVHVYVTGIKCNQGFHVIPKI